MTSPAPALVRYPAATNQQQVMVTASGEMSLLSTPLEPMGADEVLADSVLSGLSAGTELAWLAKLDVADGDAPNYYTLILRVTCDAGGIATVFTGAGLPPDSVRFGYRPLYHQPLLTAYATDCPSAEKLAASTLQLPVHPGLNAQELQWITDHIARFAGEVGSR